MISKRRPVGIDIEQVNEKVERIARKFMRKEELAFIEDEHRIPQLYVCWCAKEAVYKCFGQKEVSFVNHILLDKFTFADHGVLGASLVKDGTNLKYKVGYLQYEDYMIGYVKGE
jgi:4'-phosphopantetheinyl transferase